MTHCATGLRRPGGARPAAWAALLLLLTSAGAAAAASIEVTSVPAYGAAGTLDGVVTGVDFGTHRVAVYIQIEGAGWWTKPSFAMPTVPIALDGSFSANVVGGGLDASATILCAALVADAPSPPQADGDARIPAGLAALAMDCEERYARTFEFAGFTWAVKEAGMPAGPGDNLFSDDVSDVFVDGDGLHLTIRMRDESWWATEVFVLQSLGFGTYAFQTESRLDDLDASATFGAFTWDPWGDEEGVPGALHREIDFEDSRWGEATNPLNAQMVVQPYGVDGNRHRYTLPDLSADAALTRFFTWRADRIDFTALRGHHSAFSFPPASLIESFAYLHDPGASHFVPSEGRERFRFNLWLNQVVLGGSPPPLPAGGQPIEVIITDFRFTALPPPVPAASTGHLAILVSLLGVTTLWLLGARHRRNTL